MVVKSFVIIFLGMAVSDVLKMFLLLFLYVASQTSYKVILQQNWQT